MLRKPLVFFLILLSFYNLVNAQQPYQPTRAEMLSRYKKAQWYDSMGRAIAFKATVNARWQKDGNSFWYCNILKDSVREYIYVDASKGIKRKAFDEEQLTASLGKVYTKPLKANKLVIDSLIFSNTEKDVSFKMDSSYWQCNLTDYTCKRIERLPVDTTRYPGFFGVRQWWDNFSTDSISPDKKWAAWVKDGNIFIQSVADGNTVQYTKDGTKEKPYASLAWAPNSQYVIGYLTNPVKDSSVYFVLSSVQNTTRGKLHAGEYKQPGDPFTTYEMYLCNITNQSCSKVNTPIIDFHETPELYWRKSDPRYFLYERTDRGHQRFRIFEVNAETGESRTVVDEKTNTFIYESRLFTYHLPETNEIVMSSEKDGWRHLYLVDALTGTEKNQVTKGKWIVRSVDSIDTKKREVWFSASGMNEDEDPYYVHYYRIGLDGKNLLSLTDAKANHTVRFSPNKKYYIDSYSEINVPAITELHRTSDGKKIMDLERQDISFFSASGFKAPEPFHAKARDGITDIWGIVCKPFDFDPSKKYPVIENIYAGPQDAFVPKNFAPFNEMQSMAQLGFIVVQIDGMGTANRSKAFHDVCWKNLADAGLPDRILWIKALAAKYSYIDTSRVGVYGTSAGGQNSTGALLFHPEFYKAAASSCGCHDNRIDKQWWNEQWMGYPVGKHYGEQSNITNASKLKGKLLLIVGEADTNVPPESTYRLADALIKANKTFDFLTLPGSNHTDGGVYGRIKKRDFFVKALFGVDPPDRNANELK